MIPAYKITRLMPLKVGITGLRRDIPMKFAERIFPVPENEIDLPDGIRIKTVRGNEKLLFYFFYNVIRYYRCSPLHRYMVKNTSENDLFLDIGANLGLYSYLAKKYCRCRVLLFEPEPGHLEFLKQNQHLFDKIFDFALSDKTGETDFYVGDIKNPGGSSLVMTATGWEASGYSRVIKIKTKRLDEAGIDPDFIRKIKLIKIDVEGAEMKVVEGMQGWLNDYKFDIWCEVRGDSSARNPGSYREVCNFLSRFEYQPFIFDGRKLRTFTQKHVKQVFDILFKK